MYGILFKIVHFQFKLFVNNGTKFGAPGNRTPLNIMKNKFNNNQKIILIGIAAVFIMFLLYNLFFSPFQQCKKAASKRYTDPNYVILYCKSLGGS